MPLWKRFLEATERVPDVQDIRSAAARVEGIAIRTPLLESERLNERLGARILLKCEMFQPVGAFKIRGAWNLMSQLSEAERADGAVAFSSGNHAQAVAWAGRRLGMSTTIVMPEDAPRIKIDNTRALGAEIRLYNRANDDREEIAREIVGKSGAVIVPPYDHPDIIAGQGTVGLEIAEQCAAIGVVPDAAIVPCSGGGLIAGCAIALKNAYPAMNVFAAEPEGFDDTAKSLTAGKRVMNPPATGSICDALLVPTPGELTFTINKMLLAGGLTVSDGDVKNAMLAAFTDARLVVEPGGAAGLAAAIKGKDRMVGQTICVVLSGGNADPALFAEILSDSASAD
ncbi:MAG: threonine dehydratase [Paracoccaceae bacterium]